MGWTEIIVAFLGLLGACDLLGRLIFFRPTKRKANAEAEAVETQNDSAAIAALNEAIAVLRAQLDYANAQIVAKDEIIQAQTAEKMDLTARLTALYDDMCVHKGCKLRKPHQGQGFKWYEDHRDDPGLGCDFYSVEYMLKQWRARNAKTENEPENGTETDA